MQESRLKVVQTKPTNFDRLKVNSQISVSGFYAEVGHVFDVGIIEKTEKVKGGSCTVHIRLPHFHNLVYKYPLKLGNYCGNATAVPSRKNLWRLLDGLKDGEEPFVLEEGVELVVV